MLGYAIMRPGICGICMIRPKLSAFHLSCVFSITYWDTATSRSGARRICLILLKLFELTHKHCIINKLVGSFLGRADSKGHSGFVRIKIKKSGSIPGGASPTRCAGHLQHAKPPTRCGLEEAELCRPDCRPRETCGRAGPGGNLQREPRWRESRSLGSRARPSMAQKNCSVGIFENSDTVYFRECFQQVTL